MLFNSRLLIVIGFVFLFLPLVQGLVVEADRDLVPLVVNEKYNGVDQISDVLEEKRYSRDLRRDILERDNSYSNIHIESLRVTSHRPNDQGFVYVQNGDVVTFKAEIMSEETINEVPYVFYNNGYPTGKGSTKNIEGIMNLEKGSNILDLNMEFYHGLDTLYNTGSFITVLVVDSEKKKTDGNYYGTSIYIKNPERELLNDEPLLIEEDYSEELFEETRVEYGERKNLITGNFVWERDLEEESRAIEMKRNDVNNPESFKEVFYEDIDDNNMMNEIKRWLNELFEF